MFADALFSKIMEISILTNYDYFSISTSFYTMTNDRINCGVCSTKRNFDKIQKLQNCNEAGPNVIFPTDNFKYYRCMGAFSDPKFSVIMSMKKAYDKGINPFGGCIADIPNKAVEIFNLIENLVVERQIEEQKKWQTKHK